MKMIIYLIFILFISIPVFGNDHCKILDVLDSSEINFEKETIPKKLSKLYWKRYGFRIKIANPDEEWNNTDLVSRKENNRQLIFACKNKKSGFVFVKSGGSAISKTCILYDLKSGYIQNIGLNWSASTKEEVMDAISHYLKCDN
ncbi:MAG: hypothetical protein RLO17_16110 [Cyclobacteriaceae bacterium]